MRLPALPSLIGISLAALSGTALFFISQNVQLKEKTMKKLSTQVQQQKEEIRVLRAEWDYLNRPDRLETLAHDYLGLRAPSAQARAEDTKNLLEDVPLQEEREKSTPTRVSISPTSAATPISLEQEEEEDSP